MRGELVIPEPCYRDPNSKEMIRAWIAEGGIHATLRIGIWNYPESEYTEAASLGILLADLAHHVSRALQKENGTDPQISLAEIKKLFLEQLAAPTTDHPGDFYIRKPKET
jgi:hypothetical protein